MIQDAQLHDALARAIAAYDYPKVTFDFDRGEEQPWPSMRQAESAIRTQLISNSPSSVKNGLSNVLYWGFHTSRGIRDRRIRLFRSEVRNDQLAEAIRLFKILRGPGLIRIKKLELPQFSRASFITKLRMFLDPSRFVVMDLKLARLKYAETPTPFRRLKWREGETSIRITHRNQAVYEDWCAWCRRVAEENFGDSDIRAVDLERGMFHLVQSSQLELAAAILAAGG